MKYQIFTIIVLVVAFIGWMTALKYAVKRDRLSNEIRNLLERLKSLEAQDEGD